MKSSRFQAVRTGAQVYPRPFVMLGLLLISLGLDAYTDGLGDPLALVVVGLGAWPLVRRTFNALRQRRYALDYLALLAISAALAAGEFQVGAVIGLMLATGQALEDYGVRRAKSSLSMLSDRIPRQPSSRRTMTESSWCPSRRSLSDRWCSCATARCCRLTVNC